MRLSWWIFLFLNDSCMRSISFLFLGGCFGVALFSLGILFWLRKMSSSSSLCHSQIPKIKIK